jgi:hypothetical protein
MYSHRPLSSPKRSIRVLNLLPALHIDAPLECRLQEFEEIPHKKYEALSYVWGSPKEDRSMRCENATILITANCEAALRRLRRRTRSRILWVDSICINQSSNEEKGHQVALMKTIYSRAETVIVWLGDHTGGRARRTKAVSLLANLLLHPTLEDHYSDTYSQIAYLLRCK